MRSTRSDRRLPERGMALLAVVFLVLLLAGLSLGLVEEGLASRTSIRHHEANLRALEILEAGVVRASQEVRSLVDADGGGVGAVHGELGGGDYAISALQDSVNADRYVLTGRGTYGLSERRVEVGLRRRERMMFVEGLFSRDGLTVNGSVATDAYDSRLGTYASQAVNSDARGTYAQLGGHLGSNGPLRLTGSSVTVRGNAIPGPLQEVETSGTPVITGDRLPRELEVELDAPPRSAFDLAMVSNDNAWILHPGGGGGGGRRGGGGGVRYDPLTFDLTVTGGATVTLSSGTYFFRNLSLSGGSVLEIRGSVTIYLTETLDSTGGSIVNTGRPGDLTVYAHPYPLPPTAPPTSTQVKLNGGSSLAMALYAPQADVTMGGGIDFYGSAVARSITVGGGGGSSSTFHYDKALGTVGRKGVALLERLYWRDAAPPRR